LVVEFLPLGQHALVQDAHDENSGFLGAVKDHVPASFKST